MRKAGQEHRQCLPVWDRVKESALGVCGEGAVRGQRAGVGQKDTLTYTAASLCPQRSDQESAI